LSPIPPQLQGILTEKPFPSRVPTWSYNHARNYTEKSLFRILSFHSLDQTLMKRWPAIVKRETTNVLDFVNQTWLEYLDILSSRNELPMHIVYFSL
jgi:hypothetical protein